MAAIRDRVLRFNKEGPNGLRNRQPRSCKVTDRAFLAALVETASDPKAHGVVRWRCGDLARYLAEEFGISLHETTVVAQDRLRQAFRALPSLRPG